MYNIEIKKIGFLLWEWVIWKDKRYFKSGVTSFKHTAVKSANMAIKERKRND